MGRQQGPRFGRPRGDRARRREGRPRASVAESVPPCMCTNPSFAAEAVGVTPMLVAPFAATEMQQSVPAPGTRSIVPWGPAYTRRARLGLMWKRSCVSPRRPNQSASAHSVLSASSSVRRNATNAAVCPGSTVEMPPSGLAGGFHARSLMPQTIRLARPRASPAGRLRRGLFGGSAKSPGPLSDPSGHSRGRPQFRYVIVHLGGALGSSLAWHDVVDGGLVVLVVLSVG